MSSRLLAAVCLLIAWQLRSAFSQSITGDILGTIKDPTGAVIGGGTITLTDVGTGSKWTVSSDDSGSYLFAQLKPGRYRLETSKAGFQVAVVSDIELQVGQRPRVDVTLQLGEVGQRIE